MMLELASDQPLVIAVDDAHLMDDESRQTLMSLLRRIRTNQVLMVYASWKQSGLVEPLVHADLSRQPHKRVRLTPLSERGVAQVIADLLSVPADAVDLVVGDTDVVSAGGGSHSGRSMRHAATVFSIATKGLIEKGSRIASYLLEGNASFENGRFVTPHSSKSFDFIELARAASAALLPEELRGPLAAAADNEMHDPVFPNGCAVCECEVDPETGMVEIVRYSAVDDVGRCINPLIVHGQTHGGIAQGVGQAMWESCHVDGDGQPLAGSFMDYALPRATDLPSFRCEIVEVLSPTNPFGIKAGGEGGTTPAPAAVINAIVDALADLGVRDITMPATPFTVWKAIQEAKK